jgi:hypothetical protein
MEKGSHHAIDSRKRISQGGIGITGNKKGYIPWNKGTKGICKPNSGSFKKGQYSNENHRCWKGGITPINEKIRKSVEYKLWREVVFKRDNYTCIWCGAKSGNGEAIILNADHIKRFSQYPELRLAIDNGRTLCEDCHRTTENYGRPIKNIK